MELNCISVQQCHMIVLLGMDSKQEIGYTCQTITPHLLSLNL